MKNVCKLDANVINELRELSTDDDSDFFRRQVTLFADRGLILTTALIEALRKDERPSLRRTAHALAGSAATIGAMALRDHCLDLEECALSEDSSAVADLCNLIHDDFFEVRETLLQEAWAEDSPWNVPEVL